MNYEIIVSASGDTLWVNAFDGTCIGRFSTKFGIDVHHRGTEQAGMPQCLFCTHGRAGPEEWRLFRAAMLEHHQVDVPATILKIINRE